MASADRIAVEVAYALPDEQVIIPLEIEAGVTCEQAIARSGVLTRHPEIDLAVNKVGVFGKLTRLDTVLREGDRVEIYRPCAPIRRKYASSVRRRARR